MPASETKNDIKNNQNGINFKKKKKQLNTVLLQNDKIKMIFKYFQFYCKYSNKSVYSSR